MPLKEKEILVEAFSDMAPDYERKVNSELNKFWGWSYPGFVKELIKNTPIFKEDKILDVATGTGVISHHLADAGFSQNPIHALDITFSMLKRARDRFAKSNLGNKGELVCASAMDMPYNGGTFTLVICGLATHHMEVEKFIQESHRILISEGRLSIIDAGGSLT
jgi:ubiquinone/menaquinone biosynthesis C-methylase UbiE